jgi:predicted Ser/Thr protein kinase
MEAPLETETVPSPAGPRRDPQVPSVEELAPLFPQFELVECLGRGGKGVVYKARQKSLDRFVALKLLAPERASDPAFEARFGKEARALARLSHSSIVTVHDFGSVGSGEGRRFYLIMEFVDGVNLRQAVEAGRFTPEQALAIVPPICEALQYAHEQGVVHRDIKPENLLLDKEGRVKIADFGIAKLVGDGGAGLDSSASGRGASDQSVAGGTPRYMAPEQARDPAHVDHRADIYSLGAVLYELLTGEAPKESLEPPSRRVQMDVRLDEVVLRALEQTPELRYQTAAEFMTQIETVRSSTTSGRHEAGDPEPRSGLQRALHEILPRSWYEAIRRESRQWHSVCDCGWKKSIWDQGGIRFKAAGNPRRWVACPGCGEMKWVTVRKLDGAGDTGPGPSGERAAAVARAFHLDFRAAVALGVVTLFMLTIASITLLAVTGNDGLVPMVVPQVALGSLFAGFGWRSWLSRRPARLGGGVCRAMGWAAVLLSLGTWVLGLMFLSGALSERGGWNPAPAEAIIVPLTWLGMLALPWSAWVLLLNVRHNDRPRSPRSLDWPLLSWVALALAGLAGLVGAMALWIPGSGSPWWILLVIELAVGGSLLGLLTFRHAAAKVAVLVGSLNLAICIVLASVSSLYGAPEMVPPLADVRPSVWVAVSVTLSGLLVVLLSIPFALRMVVKMGVGDADLPDERRLLDNEEGGKGMMKSGWLVIAVGLLGFWVPDHRVVDYGLWAVALMVLAVVVPLWRWRRLGRGGSMGGSQVPKSMGRKVLMALIWAVPIALFLKSLVIESFVVKGRAAEPEVPPGKLRACTQASVTLGQGRLGDLPGRGLRPSHWPSSRGGVSNRPD